jgi:hypothetical protein
MWRCPKCGNQYPEQITVCPACQQAAPEKEASFKVRPSNANENQAFLVVVLIIIFAVGGWGFLKNSMTATPAAESPASTVMPSVPAPSAVSDSALVLDHWHWARGEYGTPEMVGLIINTSGKSYSYAQVEINLYDKQHTQLGSTIANTNNIEPHGKWKFTAPVTEKGAYSADVKKITAF